MNVTLIRPPAYSVGLMGPQLVPYLGIAYVGASLRAAGHDVDIIDMCAEDITRTEMVDGRYVQYGMAFDSLKGRLKDSAVIGFTCMFSQDWPFHRRLIQFVRRLYPSSILVAGGNTSRPCRNMRSRIARSWMCACWGKGRKRRSLF